MTNSYNLFTFPTPFLTQLYFVGTTGQCILCNPYKTHTQRLIGTGTYKTVQYSIVGGFLLKYVLFFIHVLAKGEVSGKSHTVHRFSAQN